MSKDHIIQNSLEQIMGERFGRYSKYIIQERALPDARDGLKPVQRRILYAMHLDGNTADKAYRKSVKSVGLVIGNYHPHGESSVYEAMVRMSQSWKMREMLIDMHGNNGSMDDDPAAAMRYTEARLSKIAFGLLADIEKDTVNFASNFDDTTTEPTVLPASYPNLLVNGITGIAAGYATNIPPHNLGEVIDGAIYRLKNPKCDLDAMLELIKGPDFPTGGIIQGLGGIKDAFRTGKGRVVVRGLLEVKQTKTNQQIIITEIPYEVVKANLVRKIDELRLNKTLETVLDVRDESDRNGLKIVIDLKKDSDAQVVINYLYKHTDLQVYYNYNMVAIVNKRPHQLGLIQLIDAYLAHRKEVVYRRTNYDLNKCLKRMHLVEGLIKAISVLDEIIELIRQANNKQSAMHAIIERFKFSIAQADAIVSLRLYRLTNTDVKALEAEHEQLSQTISELQLIVNDEKQLIKLIINELKLVKKTYATPRLSQVEAEIEEIVIDKSAMISNERVMITLSSDGYLKRTSLRSYQASNSLTKLKDGDSLIVQGEANTLDKLLYFTNLGNYGYLDVYQIEDAKWKDIGLHLNAYVNTKKDEKIINAYLTSNFESNIYVITLSAQGQIKKTSLKDFEVSRNNKQFSCMNLAKEDYVVSSFIASESDEVVLLTQKGYVSRYFVSAISQTGVKAKGVKAMNLSDDIMVDAQVVTNLSELIFINRLGQSKRIKQSEIAKTGRPVKGEMICKKLKANPSQLSKLISSNLNQQILTYETSYDVIEAKDISLMSKDATFSNSYDFNSFTCYELLKIIPVIEASEVDDTPKTLIENLNLNLD